MRVVDAAAVHAALGYASLTDALAEAFRAGAVTPVRHQHPVTDEAGGPGTLLLMPAWQPGRSLGIKLVTVFAANADRGLPSVHATYLLLDGETGAPRAVIDGGALTERRTAAASALAAHYLAREDASRMLMVGAGALAPHLIRAHAATRDLSEIRIWNRTAARAEALAAALAAEGYSATATGDLEAAASWAGVISCATLATAPLIRGKWLQPGTHLDLVGAFRPDMREVDDTAVGRARIFVDVRESALAEAGDIAGPLARGIIAESDIAGDLTALVRDEVRGRRSDDEITLFKSVGSAIEDLAAAQMVMETLDRGE
jgi:ornithine cyclodeaminase